MNKTTSDKLSDKLKKYSAFTAAIFGVANASGQIIYTDISDETVDATDVRVGVDINQDGTDDFLFGANSSSPNFAFLFPASSSLAPYNSNAIVGFTNSSYNYPSNLTMNSPISNTNDVFFSARGDFNYDGCAFPGSQFCDGMDGFVGLHFKIGTNTHYGWVRIQVAQDASNIIIKDFAYNSNPGEPINAGQTESLGVGESPVEDIQIAVTEKRISLYNLPDNTAFNLFSVSGQSVLIGETSGNTYAIEANALASGIYVLELNDAESNSVIRKKILL